MMRSVRSSHGSIAMLVVAGTVCGSALRCPAAPPIDVCAFGCSYRTIQAAIDAVSDGATILVRDGHYPEAIDFRGKAITVRSDNGPTTTTIGGTSIADQLNGSAVSFVSGEGRDSILQGFTLQYARGTLAGWRRGGGVYCEDSSPTISNCVIREMTDPAVGAGIYCATSSPLIAGCEIKQNDAFDNGGALYCTWHSSPTLEDCTLQDNTSGLSGAGIAGEWYSTVTVARCHIMDNDAIEAGGGVFLTESAAATISHSEIRRNKAHADGGGMLAAFDSQFDVVNTIVTGNRVIDDAHPGFGTGGGIALYNDASLLMVNGTMSANVAPERGGRDLCGRRIAHGPQQHPVGRLAAGD